MRSKLTFHVLALALVSACEPLPELTYETEHLRLGTAFDQPLCRGDLDHFERVITTVETQLQTTVEDPIEVYLWDSLQWGADPGWCTGDLYGCYRSSKVYSSLDSIDHELVHAVVATLPNDSARFWDEGAAEALQSARTFWGRSAPIDNLDLDRSQPAYRVAGHFSRWLLETRGPELYRMLLSSPRGARAAFEETYNMTLETAQAEFFEAAPYSYGALVSCDHPDLEQQDTLEWTETIDVDCDAVGVRAGPFGIGAFRVLTIVERMHYDLSTSAEFGIIGRCNDVELESPASPEPDPALGDVPPITTAFIEQYVVRFGADGETTTLDLVPGRYEVSLGSNDFERRTVEVAITASAGPVPQTPESSP